MSTPMPDSTSASADPSQIQALRRHLQEVLAIKSTAASIDGREFVCESPVEDAMPPGSFVKITTEDGRRYLGRMLESELLEREGPEVAIGADSDFPQMAALKDFQVAGVSFRVRLPFARGTGTLVGRVEDGLVYATNDDDRFANATVAPASGTQVQQYLEANVRNLPAFPIGKQVGYTPEIPAMLLATGFGRHTFLVGQSGSGKTYTLGVILEQILLHTDLRLIIIDPNSDFVHIRDVRDDVAARDPELAARYREAVRDVRVFRPAPRQEVGDEPLKIRFSNLTERAQAMVLRLDPLTDREEYEAFRTIISHMSTDTYSLADVQRAAMTSLAQADRAIALRIAALGNVDWELWAANDEPSLADIDDDWRAIVLDVGGFEDQDETTLVTNSILQTLWSHRNHRRPCLIVIDEAHNICPIEPDGPFQNLATERTISIAAEGRKFGLYLLVSTQRPGKIHPNVLSQCDNLVLMRMNSAEDLGQLRQTFSFVPTTLLERSSTFVQGESLIAGKLSVLPLIVKTGQRISQEGGGDVAADWAHFP